MLGHNIKYMKGVRCGMRTVKNAFVYRFHFGDPTLSKSNRLKFNSFPPSAVRVWILLLGESKVKSFLLFGLTNVVS